MWKINIDLVPYVNLQKATERKRSEYKDISTKRLKYCFKKRKALHNQEYKLNQYDQFQDEKSFGTPRAMINSAILNQSSNFPCQKNNSKLDPREGNEQLSRNSLGKKSKVSFQQPAALKFTKLDIQNFQKDHKTQRNRPQSHRQSCLSHGKNSQNSEKPLYRKINPYTKKQYLHMGKNKNQSMMHTTKQLKKMQQFHSILKPCQIGQKQIIERETTWKRPQTERKMRKEKQLSRKIYRSKTAQPTKREDIVLDPWDIDAHEDMLKVNWLL